MFDKQEQHMSRMVRSGAISRKIVFGILAGAVVSSLSGGVWAQKAGKPAGAAGAGSEVPDLASAKKHYGDGERKLKAGDFEGALVEFKAANEIKAAPQAERNIGLCEDNLGHLREAADWYEKFLAHVPEKLQAQGEEIQKRLSAIKAMPAKVHVESTPPGATVAVDGKTASGVTPLDVELTPGTHDLRLTAQGRLPATKNLEVTFASTQKVETELQAEPPPVPTPPPVIASAPAPAAAPPPPPPPAETRSKIPAYITGGLAVAAAGVGTVFGVMALNDKSNFDKTPTTAIADDGDTHSLIADMAFGIAITFAATSVVLFLTKDEPAAAPTSSASPARKVAVRRAPDRVTLTPVPVVGTHSGGAGLVLRF